MYDGIWIITQMKTKSLISMINENTKHPINELKNIRLVNRRYSSTMFLNCWTKPVKNPVLSLAIILPDQGNNISKRIQDSKLRRTACNRTQKRSKWHHLNEITLIKKEVPMMQHAAKPINLSFHDKLGKQLFDSSSEGLFGFKILLRSIVDLLKRFLNWKFVRLERVFINFLWIILVN